LSSGRNLRAELINKTGPFPVYGGNGLRGYTKKSNFEGECAIIGRQGAFCGNVRYFNGVAYMTEHAVVVCGNEHSDTKYLAYLLSTMDLGRLSGQSAQPGLSVKTLAQQLIELPPLSKQVAIGRTLLALDDKIANNTKINHHLEQMAQSIFKSWFVDFEPWGGTMPEDWREGTLNDICAYNSERVSVSDLTLDTYISTENMVTDRGGFVSAANLPTIPQTTAFVIGDTLISNIRPYFKKIVYCGFAGGCSTDVLCFRPHSANLSHYVYNTLYGDRFFDYMVAGSKGTKMPRGDKQQVMVYPIAIPTNIALNDFIRAVAPMVEKRLFLTDEIATLAAMRDTLLPRLMSGELNISDVQAAK